MQALKCKLCGGSLLMDDSCEYSTCESCGMKYSMDSMKKMIEALQDIKFQVDGIPSIKNLLIRASKYCNEGQYVLARQYYNKVLDIDAENAEAIENIMFCDMHLDPSNPNAVSNALAVASRKRKEGNYYQAKKYVEYAVRLYPHLDGELERINAIILECETVADAIRNQDQYRAITGLRKLTGLRLNEAREVMLSLPTDCTADQVMQSCKQYIKND